jgi:SAM-dependent methyltransferase
MYTESGLCPYTLDGVVYTPLNQKYTRNVRETKYRILKLKPEKKNSIDFYVQFERHPETKKIVTVYDRTSDNLIEDITKENIFNDVDDMESKENIYNIANLFVGKIKNNVEIPVLFQKEAENYLAYINIRDGYPRDIEGNIIQDNTVVEFSYYMDSNIPDRFRWIPLRTRYDKTEMVMKYKRKYGNPEEIANRIWMTIQNPITFKDIELLSNKDTYETHIKLLKTKITSDIVSLTRREDKYYQLVTNMAKTLRAFHNWIKSNIYYLYCAPKYLQNGKQIYFDVLEIGAGRGGDIMKLYHARVKSAVLTDENDAGLFSGADSALSRYNSFKKKYPRFPPISFVIADGGLKFNYEDQKTKQSMTDMNVRLLKSIFGENSKSREHKTFDVFSCQFMIHYLFKSEMTFNNFCDNVNKYLKSGGYILITTFDGDLLEEEFKKSSGRIYQEHIDETGAKILLFDIVKKYVTKDVNTYGLQVDVHMSSFMDEGSYITEYLVTPKMLINTLKEKCNMRLIESETFNQLHKLYNEFFVSTADYESKAETKKFFGEIRDFFEFKDEMSKKWYEYTKLNRYYILQKL